MTAANEYRYDTDILATLAQRVVVDDFKNRRRRGQDEICSAAKLVNLGNYDIADMIRGRALRGTAIAERIGSSWASRRWVTT